MPGDGASRLGRELRGRVLNRRLAFGEARDLRDRQRLHQPDRTGKLRLGLGGEAPPGEAREESRGSLPGGIHPQPERGLALREIERRLPAVGPVALQPLDHPGRMGVAALVRGHHAAQERVALALQAAQRRVDQACDLRSPEPARRLDGGGHRGVVGLALVQQLVEAHREQRLDQLVAGRQRAVEQQREQQAMPVVPAQCPEGERLRLSPVGRGQCFEIERRESLIERDTVAEDAGDRARREPPAGGAGLRGARRGTHAPRTLPAMA